MAGPITFEKVTEAIGVLLDFYEQEVENGKLKDGELKNKIEELKTNPEKQEKLQRFKKRGRKPCKMLGKLDDNINIRRYSRLVGMMLVCESKRQDADDDDDDDDDDDA